MTKKIHIVLLLFLFAALIACKNEESKAISDPLPISVNSKMLKIPDQGGRKLRGQVLYMPVYSNIPHLKKNDYNLSAFLAIHNTDLDHQIKITRIDYFNTDGRFIKSFISADQQILPFATMILPVAKEDRSGTGANFLVEWISDQPVNEPLIESVMKDLSGNKGISFLSQGRIIREIK